MSAYMLYFYELPAVRFSSSFQSFNIIPWMNTITTSVYYTKAYTVLINIFSILNWIYLFIFLFLRKKQQLQNKMLLHSEYFVCRWSA